MTEKTKRCPRCATAKPISAFGFSPSTTRIYAYCKPCHKEESSIRHRKKNGVSVRSRKDSDDLLIHGHKNIMQLEYAMRCCHA